MADERIRPGADDEAPVPGILGGGGGTVPTVAAPPPVAPAPKVLGGPGATGTVVPFPTPTPKPAPGALTTPGTPQWITDKLNEWNKTAPEAPPEPPTPPPLGAAATKNWRVAQAWAEEEAMRRYANQPKLLEATIRQIRLQAQIEESKELGDQANTAAAERIDRDNANRRHTFWLQEIEKGMAPGAATNWIEMQHNILTDPVLEKFPEHIDHLKKNIEEITGQTQSFGQGPKFDDYNTRVTSSPGTPGHIYDASEIMRIPDNEVTPKGKTRLFENYLKSQKEDGRIIEENRQSILNGMKLKVVRPETAFTRDYQGEQAFDLKIRPAYNLAYDRWRQAHPDKSPFEFFGDTQLQDQIIEWGYPKAEKDRNDKAAENEDNAAIAAQQHVTPAMQPVRPAPEGINPGQWTLLAGAPPTSKKTGRTWTVQDWEASLEQLYNNPSPEMKRDFNQMFAASLQKNADQVLEQLRRPFEGPVMPGTRPWWSLPGEGTLGVPPQPSVPPRAPPGEQPPTAPEVRQRRIEGLTAEIEKYQRQASWEFIPAAARAASREQVDKLRAELDELTKIPR